MGVQRLRATDKVQGTQNRADLLQRFDCVELPRLQGLHHRTRLGQFRLCWRGGSGWLDMGWYWHSRCGRWFGHSHRCRHRSRLRFFVQCGGHRSNRSGRLQWWLDRRLLRRGRNTGHITPFNVVVSAHQNIFVGDHSLCNTHHTQARISQTPRHAKGTKSASLEAIATTGGSPPECKASITSTAINTSVVPLP